MSAAVSDRLGSADGGAAAGAAGFAGAAAAAGAAGCACAAAALVRSVRMMVPSLTRSPTFALRSCTTPPSGDGTSIEALSDSRVTNGCSGWIVSPALTMTSMIGTSLKSPMSGTRTSATPAGALVGAGGAVTAGFAACAAPPLPSSSRVRIGTPWLTRSPSCTAMAFTTPADGEGTSIDALSDSSVISGASTAMRSPGFTWISMIGTSLKSPMSGTRTCLVSPIVVPHGCVRLQNGTRHLVPRHKVSVFRHMVQGGGRSGSIP